MPSTYCAVKYLYRTVIENISVMKQAINICHKVQGVSLVRNATEKGTGPIMTAEGARSLQRHSQL